MLERQKAIHGPVQLTRTKVKITFGPKPKLEISPLLERAIQLANHIEKKCEKETERKKGRIKEREKILWLLLYTILTGSSRVVRIISIKVMRKLSSETQFFVFFYKNNKIYVHIKKYLPGEGYNEIILFHSLILLPPLTILIAK